MKEYYSYLHYVASNDDLCEIIQFSIVSDFDTNYRILYNYGKTHYKDTGKYEIHNKSRIVKHFNTWNYLANMLHKLPTFLDPQTKKINHELLCYYWITYDFANNVKITIYKHPKFLVNKRIQQLT